MEGWWGRQGGDRNHKCRRDEAAIPGWPTWVAQARRGQARDRQPAGRPRSGYSFLSYQRQPGLPPPPVGSGLSMTNPRFSLKWSQKGWQPHSHMAVCLCGGEGKKGRPDLAGRTLWEEVTSPAGLPPTQSGLSLGLPTQSGLARPPQARV